MSGIALPDDATVRVIGLGGIGQPVATYLARFLASLGRPSRLLLIDGDAYEPHNETRMEVHEVYRNKAEATQAELARCHADSALSLLAVPEYVTPDNVERLLPAGPGESVLMCVDNHATRKLVAEHVEGLDDILLVSGGNDGVGPDSGGVVRQGTAGNVQVYVKRGGVEHTDPLTRYHPEIATPRDARPDEQGCDDLAGSVPQIMFTNLFVAACMLSTWWLHWGGGLDYWELVFKLEQGRMAPVLPLPASRVQGAR
ncbi:MAG: ThiF family adenylyltransferase [Planctomycetota bacterium]